MLKQITREAHRVPIRHVAPPPHPPRISPLWSAVSFRPLHLFMCLFIISSTVSERRLLLVRTVINSSNLPPAFIRLPLYPSIFSLPSTFRCCRCQQMMGTQVNDSFPQILTDSFCFLSFFSPALTSRQVWLFDAILADANASPPLLVFSLFFARISVRFVKKVNSATAQPGSSSVGAMLRG